MARPRFFPQMASLGLVLFALPFLAVGVFMTGWLWQEVLRSHEMVRTWRTVPGVIEWVTLEAVKSGKGGKTYRVTGSYRYLYEGKTYQSGQITLGTGTDNLGQFHQRLHRQMQRAQQENEPMHVFVNPAHPAEAILWPWWRLEMGLFKAIFGIVFGGVGAGLAVGSLVAWRVRRAQTLLRAAHPAEPWRWRADWAAGFARPDFTTQAVTAWTTLVALHAPTLPLWSGGREAWAKGGVWLAVFAVALLGVGVGTVLAVRTLARVRRHRDLRVVLPELPLRPGRPVRLEVVLAKGLAGWSLLKTEVHCVQRRRVGGGKKSRVDEIILWQATETHPGPFYPGQVLAWAPVLPADQPGADPVPGDEGVIWRLLVSGQGPGPDLLAYFDLPVFSP